MPDLTSLKGEPTALVALAAGATITEAAAVAEVNERTIRRRLELIEYRALVAQLRSRYIEEALGLLSEATVTAVRTLVELTETGPPTVRLGAARSILEHAVSLEENIGIRDRLTALEQVRYQELHAEATLDPRALPDG